MSMHVEVAEGATLKEILDLTHEIWHEGLSRDAYERWNGALMRTSWGRERLRRLALLDEQGRLLASAKRYRFDARVAGREVPVCGIGALFVPPDRRGHGYGRALLEHMIEKERANGQGLMALFSEIGETYYRRLGFEVAPVQEATVEVSRKDGAPAILMRSGEETDLGSIAAMHDARSASAGFALRRDPELIQHAISKRRLFAGLSPPGVRSTEFFVAEEGASAVAYVVITSSRGGWTIEEAGDRDPAAARLGALLQVLIARDPSTAPRLVRAWWPPALPAPPQVRLTARTFSRDLLMLKPLTNEPVPRRAEDVYYWRSDVF